MSSDDDFVDMTAFDDSPQSTPKRARRSSVASDAFAEAVDMTAMPEPSPKTHKKKKQKVQTRARWVPKPVGKYCHIYSVSTSLAT